MFDIAVSCLVLTALLSYRNHRFVGLPPMIGVMGIALLLPCALIGVDKLGIGLFLDDERSPLLAIDFSEVLMHGMPFVLIGLQVILIPVSGGTVVTGPKGLFGRVFKPPRRSWRVLTRGSLRGGIAVALALTLPAAPERDFVLALTYSVVAFSILCQGLTIGSVVRRAVSLPNADGASP